MMPIHIGEDYLLHQSKYFLSEMPSQAYSEIMFYQLSFSQVKLTHKINHPSNKKEIIFLTRVIVKQLGPLLGHSWDSTSMSLPSVPLS